jgi:hypothetical protein
MRKLAVLFLVIIISVNAQPYLSNLSADKDDPIYTTYAAPMSRSEYKIDQGYQLMWYDEDRGVDFITSNGGDICLAFKFKNELRYKLQQFYEEPVITASYSDLVKLYYYPYQNIKVEIFFDVYSSRIAIQDVKITNELNTDVEIDVYPYFNFTGDKIKNASFLQNENAFVFNHNKKRDGWMLNHNIPLVEDLQSIYMIDQSVDRAGCYSVLKDEKDNKLETFISDAEKDSLNSILSAEKTSVLFFNKKLQIAPHQTVSFRIIRGMDSAENNFDDLLNELTKLSKVDLEQFLLDDEKLYSKIPKIRFKDEDYEMLYWNAFSLIRQCMMPPEGESSYNYYVFSREPKWGWGYGGQVFHESLVMIAYSFMDPESAMNSQRVYMERQWDSGYINYRTGPYLNEQIEHNGQYTSSAPWYNYQNYEIYKVTNDKQFLSEAYESGKKFYNYYVSNRDADNDGLCEWGAHAVLECVRDARVAVWDKVDWPSNFEGIDLNVMLVSEANALSEMAEELGKTDEAANWKRDAEKRTELINKTFWDSETEFFYNVDKNDQDFSFKTKNDLKIQEIIGFLPLWANTATDEHAEKLMKHLTNPNTFWRRFGIPTLSAEDDYYNPIGYWNGPIWVQWQYLIFRGLINYGYNDEAKQLVYKVLDNVINQLKTDHWFWEFYSADDYQAGWNKAYIWTGIVARMLIDIENL